MEMAAPIQRGMEPDHLAFDAFLPNEAATSALAACLWPLCNTGDVIALWGDLGAGKTSFARGFVRTATHPEEEVPSPTFTLLQTYETTGITIYHFDLYRIESPDEVIELGVEDAFSDGISLIEWPGRMGYWLPPNRLDVTLTSSGKENQESGRSVTLSAPSATWGNRLQHLDLRAFHDHC